MPKGGRSMTIEEKNKVLELNRQKLSIRKIGKIVKKSVEPIHTFLEQAKEVEYYTRCPACGKLIPHYSNSLKHRQRIYCSEKCRQSKAVRKTQERVCLYCGKTFIAWKYSSTKFCSISCCNKHRHGKRLQNKSS